MFRLHTRDLKPKPKARPTTAVVDIPDDLVDGVQPLDPMCDGRGTLAEDIMILGKIRFFLYTKSLLERYVCLIIWNSFHHQRASCYHLIVA